MIGFQVLGVRMTIMSLNSSSCSPWELFLHRYFVLLNIWFFDVLNIIEGC